MMMSWHGVDLHWAYADLLPSIQRQTSSKHHAYDILHDALVRFAMTRNPDRKKQPHAYLRAIVRNLLIDSYKDMARFVPLAPENGESSEDGAGACRLESEERFSPSPEHLADLQQRLKIMQDIINRLPPRCREVFWLYRIEGLGQQAIAEKMGITLNMVQRHVMRAFVDLMEAHDLIR